MGLKINNKILCDECKKEVTNPKQAIAEFSKGFFMYIDFCEDCYRICKERNEGPEQLTLFND
jgi:hypothetical protein